MTATPATFFWIYVAVCLIVYWRKRGALEWVECAVGATVAAPGFMLIGWGKPWGGVVLVAVGVALGKLAVCADLKDSA